MIGLKIRDIILFAVLFLLAVSGKLFQLFDVPLEFSQKVWDVLPWLLFSICLFSLALEVKAPSRKTFWGLWFTLSLSNIYRDIYNLDNGFATVFIYPAFVLIFWLWVWFNWEQWHLKGVVSDEVKEPGAYASFLPYRNYHGYLSTLPGLGVARVRFIVIRKDKLPRLYSFTRGKTKSVSTYIKPDEFNAVCGPYVKRLDITPDRFESLVRVIPDHKYDKYLHNCLTHFKPVLQYVGCWKLHWFDMFYWLPSVFAKRLNDGCV